MKKFFALALFSFLVFSCTAKKFDSQKNLNNYSASSEPEIAKDFVQGSEDIPLLVGMDKVLEESLGFDSNSGSIMSSTYQTKIDLEKVRNFYLKTLPQMGWKIKDSDIVRATLRRENEKLEIEFVNQDGQDVVKFFISSAL